MQAIHLSRHSLRHLALVSPLGTIQPSSPLLSLHERGGVRRLSGLVMGKKEVNCLGKKEVNCLGGGLLGERVVMFQGMKNLQLRVSPFCTKTDETAPKTEIVYNGPLHKSVRMLKVFSLISCFTGLASVPIMLCFGKASIPFAGKLILSLTSASFGCLTTAVLSYVSSPYVLTLATKEGDPDTFTAETYNLFLQKKLTTFHISEIEPIPNIPFITFRAKDQRFFLHQPILESNEKTEKLAEAIEEAEREELSEEEEEEEEYDEDGKKKKKEKDDGFL